MSLGLTSSTPPVVVSPSLTAIEIDAITHDIAISVGAPGVDVSVPTTGISVVTNPQGPPGPAGPPGLADPVWIIKPDATLTYDVDGLLVRVDYDDGTFKDLTYSGADLLTEVSGDNLDGDTVTKTLGYDLDDNLVTVTTVVT